MADPVFIDLTKDIWTVVATNVTEGAIRKKSRKPQQYNHMYVDTGNPAPIDIEDGVQIFLDGSNTEAIGAGAGIDVYIMPIGENGRVRVDL